MKTLFIIKRIMGLYDSVFIDEKIIENYNIKCPKCNFVPLDKEFQTKDFESCMDSYFLSYDSDKKIRLKKLDPPKNKKYWHEFSALEIEEWNDQANENKFMRFFKRKKGDGYWKMEAFFPKNRKQRDMGELPHQFVEFSIKCRCEHCSFITLNIKFTDGIMVSLSKLV